MKTAFLIHSYGSSSSSFPDFKEGGGGGGPCGLDRRERVTKGEEEKKKETIASRKGDWKRSCGKREARGGCSLSYFPAGKKEKTGGNDRLGHWKGERKEGSVGNVEERGERGSQIDTRAF